MRIIRLGMLADSDEPSRVIKAKKPESQRLVR
jgi:hypothetical protein